MSYQYVVSTRSLCGDGTPCSSVTTLPDGSTATLSRSGVLTLFTGKRSRTAATLGGDQTILSSTLTPHGDTIFVALTTLSAPHEVQVSLWDTTTLQSKAKAQHAGGAHLLALDSKSGLYAVGSSLGDSAIRVYDARESTFGTQVHSTSLPHNDSATSLCISTTSLLAIGTESSRVELYNLEGLQHIGSYTWSQRPSTPIISLAFDSDHLYVGISSGSVVVYDIGCLPTAPPRGAFQPILTWTPHSTRPAHILRPQTLRASADGSVQRVLLTGSNYDTALHLWDFTTRVGSRPSRLASVDVGASASGLQPRGVRDVRWRDVDATTATSRGAFVVVAADGMVKAFRAAGEVGEEDDQEDEDTVDSSDAQAPVVAGQV